MAFLAAMRDILIPILVYVSGIVRNGSYCTRPTFGQEPQGFDVGSRRFEQYVPNLSVEALGSLFSILAVASDLVISWN